MSLNKRKEMYGNLVFIILFGMVGLLGISGCSSNSMSLEAKEKINNQTGFNIENIQVNLIKNPFFSEDEKHALYMSTTELAKGLKISLKKELHAKQIDCQVKKRCLNVDVNVDYTRAFILASNMLDKPKIVLNIQIKDNQKVIHTQQSSEFLISHGTLNSILVQTYIGSNEIDTEREVLDFEFIAKEIADRLIKLTN